jgi:hypothetical protein
LRNRASPCHKTGREGPGDFDLVLRDLDCAVLNFALRDEESSGLGAQTVRGVFVEGEAAYPGAEIYVKTHVQIAVRDPSCILGYFLPANAILRNR